MSIFGTIKERIFGKLIAPNAAHNRAPQAQPQADKPAMPQMQQPAAPAAQSQQAQPQQAQPQPQAPQPAAQEPVDVESVLMVFETERGTADLNWRSSIVDLMKLIGLDSSLENRKQLATELGYTGAKDGSAEMNIWLHKAVMKELEKNGGKVPSALKD
jgi:hypothetical protein